MTGVSKILVVSAAFYFIGFSFADQPKTLLSVTVWAQADTMKSGDEVILYAAAKNLSNADITLMTPPRLGENFMVKMIRPGGKIETKYYVPAGSHGPVVLKSGDEVREEILLSKKFDMSEPGEYIIQAGPVGPVPPDDLKVLAWSNSIAVRVVK
jgi:hypothetical protein